MYVKLIYDISLLVSSIRHSNNSTFIYLMISIISLVNIYYYAKLLSYYWLYFSYVVHYIPLTYWFYNYSLYLLFSSIFFTHPPPAPFPSINHQFVSIIYTFWILSFYQIYHLQNIFSYSVGSLFVLLMVLFAMQKLFSSM